ncbi:MAG: serine/threonine protein kinase [Deltaproteobacteria bacterium]|nr:MAG: serine/threonine protein kinase [Deltaproteobacteria bacterium]
MKDAAPPLADGRYRLLSVLGRGGMATVYRGLDTRLDVERAIKVLDPNLALDPQLRGRFEDEARTLARLHHDNLVTVHDVGADDNRVYFVMEWVPGGSLREHVRDQGPMTLREAARVVDGMLAGLGYAHEHGVVHRDIKPHNVLLAADGSARVADFGIARTQSASGPTRTGAVMGTWAYMAPEQRTSATNADARTDLYATAATLYAVLTGREPVDLHASDSHATLFRDLPPAVRHFIAQGTRYHAADRFQSAEDMRRALAGLVDAVGDTMALAAPPASADAPPITNPSDTFGLSALGIDTVNPTPPPIEPPPDTESTLPDRGEDVGTLPPAGQPPPRAGLPWAFILLAVVGISAVWFAVDLGTLPQTTWHRGLMPTVDGLVPLGAPTKPAHLGQSLWRVTRDEKGHPVDMMRVNGADYVWPYDADANDVAAGYRLAWEDEQVVAIDVVNEAAVPVHRMVLERDGDTLTVRHRHPEGGAAQSGASLDLRYPDFPSGDAPVVEVYTVDAEGRFSTGMWFDASGQPAQGPDRAWGARYDWDEQGRLARRTALDARGNDMIGAGGVVSAVWTYAEEAPGPVSVHYEAFAGVPARSTAGVHRIHMGYDAQGRRNRWDFLDIDGEPVRHRVEYCAGWRIQFRSDTRVRACLGPDGSLTPSEGGWYQTEARFDDRHMVVEMKKLDAQAHPMDSVGWSRRLIERDDLSRLVVRGPFFRADGTQTHVPEYGENVARVEASYDARGNLVEIRHVDADGALVAGPDGAAIVRMTYDGTRRIEWRGYDTQSMPVMTEHGYASAVQKWDERGYLVELTVLDVHDRPVVWDKGWATMLSEFDDAGRPTAERFLDADGRPIATSDGYASKTWTYDGSTWTYRLYDVDGELTVGSGGWAVEQEIYDARGLEAEERFFGADEQPLAQEQGEVARKWSYDSSGQKVEKHLIGDALLTPCVRTVYEWDARGNLTLVGCRNAEGDPVPFRADVAFSDQRGEYDASDRQTLATFWSPAGERVVRPDGCWALTYDYPEDAEEADIRCDTTPPVKAE